MRTARLTCHFQRRACATKGLGCPAVANFAAPRKISATNRSTIEEPAHRDSRADLRQASRLRGAQVP